MKVKGTALQSLFNNNENHDKHVNTSTVIPGQSDS